MRSHLPVHHLHTEHLFAIVVSHTCSLLGDSMSQAGSTVRSSQSQRRKTMPTSTLAAHRPTTQRLTRGAGRASRADALTWIGVAVAFAMLFAATWYTADARRTTTDYLRLSVRTDPGDTAWSLAREYPVPGLSTAETAQLILTVNKIGSGPVPAGTVIVVPRVSTAEVAMR